MAAGLNDSTKGVVNRTPLKTERACPALNETADPTPGQSLAPASSLALERVEPIPQARPSGEEARGIHRRFICGSFGAGL